MKMNNRWRIGLGGGAILLVGLCIGLWNAFHTEEETELKIHRFECTQMPPNDDGLIAWLKSQPNVSKVSVQRDAASVAVKYALTVGQAPPDLLGKVGDLGYTLRIAPAKEGKKRNIGK